MAQYINKSAIKAEIERRLEALANTSAGDNREFAAIIGAQHYELINLVQYIDTLEVKEVDTWHLQEKENIYDAVKDWSLHTFACIMKDGTIQKFTGNMDEDYEGHINVHIDGVNDDYDNVDDIVKWIEYT